MKFEKSPPWLVDLFKDLVGRTEAEQKLMFGYPAGFRHGNMFAGLFAESLIVRLGEADRAELLAKPGAATFDPMGGRPMKEYVVVPPDMLEDEKVLSQWLARAFAFVDSMPPKAAKKAGAAKPSEAKSAAKKPAAKKPAAKRK